MTQKVVNIVNGYSNLITGQNQSLYEQRYPICQQCDKNWGGVCSECGCVLAAKTRVKEESCPLKKW